MGRTNDVTIMTSTVGQQDDVIIGQVRQTPGATLWAFVLGVLVGIAVQGLR
jgi:hypothetical protein